MRDMTVVKRSLEEAMTATQTKLTITTAELEKTKQELVAMTTGRQADKEQLESKVININITVTCSVGITGEQCQVQDRIIGDRIG